ncbi:anti-sigma factor family protein [Streptomyces pristinaespiralis]|uniref:anti-sigma factor family protein n=1 Tax=Streptomyces pristinaespiralis TaxID=38300 RepID=UPI0037B8A889
MTSADTTEHPHVSEISDLTEGLLPPARTAEVRRHLDDCPLCADVRTSLEEIRGLLGTLPGPPRMPADIAGRINAALAAEALLEATAPEERDHVSRETVPRSSAAETASPAVRPAGHPRAATGPGRNVRARRRRGAVLGAVFGAAAVGVGVMFLQSAQTNSANDSSAAKKETSVSSAARDSAEFSGSTIGSRVQSLLAAGPTQEAEPRIEKAPSLDSGPATMSPKDAPDAAVPACIQQGTGRSDNPIAAERGTYEGVSAYLVLMAHAKDSSQVQAYVVDAACVDRAANPPGELLLTQSYPRP